MLARGGDVLRRDPDACAAARRPSSRIRFGRHYHPAARDLEIERLVEPVAAVLQQHVLAGHSSVRGAVLHVGRHIGGADDDHGNAGTIRAQNELARNVGSSAGTMPAAAERQRLVIDAPLGQGNRERGHGEESRWGLSILPDGDCAPRPKLDP